MTELAQLAWLAERIQELLDRIEITELIHEYARGLDLNRTAAVAALFTEDCIVDFSPSLGGPLHGPREVEETMRRALARYNHTSHHMSNIHLRLTGADRAEGTSYVLAWHRPADGQPDAIFYGQYEDIFVRTAVGWRFAERRELAAGHVNMRPEWNWIPREAPASSD